MLDISRTYEEVFELVKRSVENVLGSHRAGLTLILVELPNHIGAYHTLGSNSIVMNKTILKAVRLLAKSEREFNSYVYSILMHEYLHTLGITTESDVRYLVEKVSKVDLGPSHIATSMAKGNLVSIYPELKFLGPGRAGQEFKIIKDFDCSSMTYIR